MKWIVAAALALAVTPAAAAQSGATDREIAFAKTAETIVFGADTAGGPLESNVQTTLELPPGDYELFVAVRERSAAAAKNQATPAARNGLLRHAVLAPDFNKTDLQTSSVILATTVEPLSGQLSPAEQESNPYVFGPMRIVPSKDGRFGKNNELQVIFWVYGTGFHGSLTYSS